MNDQSEARELLSFQILYQSRQIKATWALATIIAGMFLLEELFGGSNALNVLVKMGANVRELVQQGQYFRLLTSVFLHAGWLHVLVNTYVLFALGGFFNRILGDVKYVSLFLISGLAGSIASFLLGSAKVSVGASGALWGLFGASVVIAFVRSSLIPDVLRVRLRRVTLINLALNLGVSFLPMVDFWAHIGGGIGGVLWSLLFVFEPHKVFLLRAKTYFIYSAALLLSLAYASAIGRMLLVDKPWIQNIKSPLIQVEFPDLPFSMALPEGMAQTPGPHNNASNANFSFGDLKFDPMVIEVHFFRAGKLVGQQGNDWLEQQKAKILDDKNMNAEMRKSVDLRKNESANVLFFTMPLSSDLMTYNYIFIRFDYIVKLVFVVHKGSKQNEIEQMAKKIIASIKPVAEKE